MPPHEKKHRHVPPSRALRFADRAAIEALLQPLVAREEDRKFVLRCILDEGPLHHRGANDLLLRLIGRALALVPGDDAPVDGVEVPMRLPPHLEDEVEEGVYPVRLPTQALSTLVHGEPAALDAAVDCLTDGPPQHALANVVMVALLERLLRRLEAKK